MSVGFYIGNVLNSNLKSQDSVTDEARANIHRVISLTETYKNIM